MKDQKNTLWRLNTGLLNSNTLKNNKNNKQKQQAENTIRKIKVPFTNKATTKFKGIQKAFKT